MGGTAQGGRVLPAWVIRGCADLGYPALFGPDGITPALIEDIFLEGRPTVIDVWIDSEVVPPIHGRIESVDKNF